MVGYWLHDPFPTVTLNKHNFYWLTNMKDHKSYNLDQFNVIF